MINTNIQRQKDMAKLCIIFVLALVLVHAAARNIPTQTKETNHIENTHHAVSAAGVDDQKNFITYGGVGGCAGIGGVAGVLPVVGGVGGGAGGLGGAGGGVGGLGGIGKAGGGIVKGAGIGGGVGGGIGAGGLVP